MLCKLPGMRLQVKRLSRTRPPRLSSLEQKYFSKVSSGIRKSWQMPPLSFKPFTINAKRHWVQKGKVSTVQPLRVSRLHTAMNLALLTHNGLSVCYFRSKLQSNRKGWETSKLQGKCQPMYDAIPQLLSSCRRNSLNALVLAAQVRKVKLWKHRFYPTYCQWALTSWVSQSLRRGIKAYMYVHVVSQTCSGCLTSVAHIAFYRSTQ